MSVCVFVCCAFAYASSYGNPSMVSENGTLSMLTTTTGAALVPLEPWDTTPPETTADVGDDAPGVPGARITNLAAGCSGLDGVDATTARSRIGLVPEEVVGLDTSGTADGMSVNPLLFPDKRPGVNVVIELGEEESALALTLAVRLLLLLLLLLPL